jgi:putative oxidoreductase
VKAATFQIRKGWPLQRLFSMFPNGWPGRGLLILRLISSVMVIQDGCVVLIGPPHPAPAIFVLVAAAAGILLVIGLWTPVAGIVVAASELVIALSGTDQLRSTVLLIAFGVSIAMLGPGTWSVDALLFGRQRLNLH